MPKLTLCQRELAKFGYVLEHTGGNCTALMHTEEHAEGSTEWVVTMLTVEDEPTAPERMKDKVTVGEYLATPEGIDWGAGEMTDGYTLADIITALNAKGDEYTLLSLRLSNYVR